MNISKEILNTIDGLAERFGVVIDWSKENVYPQVADACERFIHYELACQWVWFALFAIILTIGIVLIVMMAKDRRDFVKMIKDGKFMNRSGAISDTSRFYQYNHYPYTYRDKSGYNISEVCLKDFGCVTIGFLIACLIVGALGVVYNLVALIKLYIIPEMEIINYITSTLN